MVSARTWLVLMTLPAPALTSNASFNSSTAPGPQRAVSLPNVEGCGTRVPSGIRQNRVQEIESATSRHKVSYPSP